MPIRHPRLPPDNLVELIRALDGYFTLVDNACSGNLAELFLPGLPRSGYALQQGAVWNKDGVLFTVLTPPFYYVGSGPVTAVAGAVSVTIV